MLLNIINPFIDLLLSKNQKGFRTNILTTGKILTIKRIIEETHAKRLPATILFIDYSKAFDSIHRGKMKVFLKVYGIPEVTVNVIMIAYSSM